MKKLLLLLAAIGMVAMGCQTDNDGLDNGGNDGGTTTPPTTETAKIASIEEQGANITATLTSLEGVKLALNTTIEALKQNTPATRGNDNGVKEQIANLQGQINSLEDIIIRLTAYTGGELVEMEDWAEATFATLEQQDALATELVALKATVAGLDTVSSAELADAVAASEASMNKWVNEQLSGYATVADMNAQIATLQASLTEDSEALREDVAALVASLDESKKKITSSYKKAIKTAINDFAGVVNEQISNEIAAVNARLDEELATINSRLDDIEARLDKIEDKLEQLVKQIQSLEYIDPNGDEPTPVVTSADATTVTLNFRVTPMNAAVDLALNWQKYVKVQGYYLDDINTIVNLPITSYSGNGDTGMISITASGENLSDKFYTDLQQASIYLKISDGNNDRGSSSISIKAQRWMREDTKLLPANNEIYYTSLDLNYITPNKVDVFGATLQSNLYNWKKGVFVLNFDGEVTSVGVNAFNSYSTTENNSTLKFVMLPNSVTSIGQMAFHCARIVDIRLSENLISIGKNAFNNCSRLISITIPETVTTVGKDAFSYCSRLQKFYGKFASKDNCCLIIDGVLHRTVSIFPTTEYTLPEEVKKFGDGCIYIKTSNFSLTIPDSVEGLDANVNTVTESSGAIRSIKGKFVIGERSMVIDGILCGVAGYGLKKYNKMSGTITKIAPWLMYNCSSLEEMWLSESITEIGSSAFKDCSNLKFIYCAAITPPTIGSNVFDGVHDDLAIFVPRESLTQYQESSSWRNFATRLVPYDFE